MNALTMGALVFACCFGAALLGLAIRVPNHHGDGESKDAVKVVMALVATMAALVLSLLISSAKSSFETQNGNMLQVVADVIQLDRALANYGPETLPVREHFREALEEIHDQVWTDGSISTANLDPARAAGRTNALGRELQSLEPRTDLQRTEKEIAVQLGRQIMRTRLLMFQQVGGQIPWPFFMVLVFWIAMLFLGFGLFTRFNVTVVAAMLVGALSVASAVFLILELNQPYAGLLQISDAPLRAAMANMAR